MKKILFGLLIFSAVPVMASYFPSGVITNGGGQAPIGYNTATSSPIPTAGSYTEITSLSATGAGQSIVSTTDVSGYNWYSFQTTGTWSATLQVKQFNDPNTPIQTSFFNIGNQPTLVANSIASNSVWMGQISARYIDINVSAYTSGTIQGVIEFHTGPFPTLMVNSQVTGQSGNNAGVAGNPVLMGVDMSSTTMPNAGSDGSNRYILGNNMGQMSITGIASGLIISTNAPSIPTSESVVISTPAANICIKICNAIFTNESATNVAILLASPTQANGKIARIGSPANFIPAGTHSGPLCSNPLFIGKPASQITIMQSAVATSVDQIIDYILEPCGS